MSKSSRQILAGALALILLNSACGSLLGGYTPGGTVLSSDQNQLPAATATSTGLSFVPLIPITGENTASVQCQFCAGEETHAILVFPDFAYFDVMSTSPVNCLTANVVNGRRILICRGAQSTSFTLNICSDTSNCLQFPVALQPCALLHGAPTTPVFLTPNNRSSAEDGGDPAQPGSTAAPTSAPPSTNPAAATEPPAQPTQPPKPTKGGGGDGDKIVICHVSPGNPDEKKTMTVGENAWKNEHSKHGDSRGPCP